MPPMLEQLSLGLPELASDQLEQLVAEEIAREAADPRYGLTLIRLGREELGDAP